MSYVVMSVLKVCSVSELYSDDIGKKCLNLAENNHVRRLGVDICIIRKWIARVVSKDWSVPAGS